MSGTTRDSRLDRDVEDTFPASDPHSTTPPPGSRKAEQRHEGAADPGGQPKGRPSSDRHSTETAAGRQDGVDPAEHKSR